MRNRRAIIVLFLLLGIGVSVYWAGLADVSGFISHHPIRLVLCLLFTVALSLFNLALRWFRWHALTRRSGLRLATRSSALVYLATLPSILTPFYIGEWSRALLLRRRHPRSIGPVLFIWFLERSTDLFVLLSFYLLAARSAIPLAGVTLFWIGCHFLTRWVVGRRRLSRFSRPSGLLMLYGTTALAWASIVLALWGVLSVLGASPSIRAAALAFSGGTLLGGFTGLPQGIGVTGSAIINILHGTGTDLGVAVITVTLFRAGTAWFAVALGGAAFWFGRRSLAERLFKSGSPDHFDQIAETYEEQIPSHVRERLLQRKIDIMLKGMELEESNEGVCGLDIGCGQGWYCTALAERGVGMSAIDASVDQIRRARVCSPAAPARVDYCTAGADRLPFPDACFDFCYAINVMHHIVDPAVRDRAFSEIVRVLKPGAVFYLHEMNVSNPIFRLYINYLFPLLRNIDEGTERWLQADQLPDIPGASWETGVEYLTFTPDFIPLPLFRHWIRLENYLENTALRRFSAHYLACLRKREVEVSCKINKRIRKTG